MRHFSSKQVAGMFITGAAIGTVMTLLYAPKSGVETRKVIRKFTKKSANRLDDLQEDLRGHVSEWVENVSDVIKDGLHAGKKLSTETCQKVLGTFDTAKQAVEEGKTRLERLIRTA